MAIANTILIHKKSGITGNTPSSLANGEMALNYADGKLYYKNSTGKIAYFYGANNGPSFATANANNTLIVASVPNDTLSLVPSGGITVTANTTTKTITFGYQGAGGAQGAQGAQGFQGVLGAQGVQGAVGAQGVQGATGAQGFQGVLGAQGVQLVCPLHALGHKALGGCQYRVGIGLAAYAPQQAFGLKSGASAHTAGRVAAVLGQQHPDVHFVGLAFQVFKKPVHAKPVLVPFAIPLRRTLEHPLLLRRA